MAALEKPASNSAKPAPEDTLQRWRVPKRINSSKAPVDDATLIGAVSVAL